MVFNIHAMGKTVQGDIDTVIDLTVREARSSVYVQGIDETLIDGLNELSRYGAYKKIGTDGVFDVYAFVDLVHGYGLFLIKIDRNNPSNGIVEYVAGYDSIDVILNEICLYNKALSFFLSTM